MANDVTPKTPSLPPALVQKIAEGLARSYGGAGHALRTGMPILKLDRGGKGWSFGQENNPVQKGSTWLVSTSTFKHGIVVWNESKIVHEEMVEGWMEAPSIPQGTHPTGQPYKRQVQVELRCLNGEDAGTEVIYKISSDGGTERLSELGRIAGARIGQYAETSPYLYPVVTLGQDYYDNKQYGSRIYKPVFELIGWANADGELEQAGENVIELQKPAATEPAKPAKPPLEQPAAGQRRRPGR